ncbi:MAG: enolase [Thermoplasmata archaeon]|nr:enolase [Thermoplasmata archaeon]
MSAITDVALRLIYDSRGKETVEATVTTRSGAIGVAGAPSGASTGSHEARAFPPGGVSAALERFPQRVRPRLIGVDNDGPTVDARLHDADGTDDFHEIGGNVATAISIAAALARGRESGRSLLEVVRRPGVPHGRFPAIVGNSLNGGRHAVGGPDIQEFIAFSPAPHPRDSVRAALAVHAEIGAALVRRFPGAALGRGDEGGWVAPLSNVEALEILTDACHAVTDRLHVEVHPGLDLAASEFFRDGRYRYKERTVDSEGQVALVAEWVDRFGIRYLEDPVAEEEYEPLAEVTRAVGGKTLVVGDDIYVSRRDRLVRMGETSPSNAILIKVNQVGTLTDTLATVDEARRRGMATVTSHRSGDLPEGWLAHLAVGFGSAGMKCGLLGGERVAKLNELLRLGAATGAD